jgi:flagellar capping protein FliD
MSSGISDDITGSVRAAITGYESSVTSLNKTIADRTDVISKLRDALTKRYSTADAAIGQLNAQQTSLTTIMTSYNNSLSKN